MKSVAISADGLLIALGYEDHKAGLLELYDTEAGGYHEASIQTDMAGFSMALWILMRDYLNVLADCGWEDENGKYAQYAGPYDRSEPLSGGPHDPIRIVHWFFAASLSLGSLASR